MTATHKLLIANAFLMLINCALILANSTIYNRLRAASRDQYVRNYRVEDHPAIILDKPHVPAPAHTEDGYYWQDGVRHEIVPPEVSRPPQ